MHLKFKGCIINNFIQLQSHELQISLNLMLLVHDGHKNHSGRQQISTMPCEERHEDGKFSQKSKKIFIMLLVISLCRAVSNVCIITDIILKICDDKTLSESIYKFCLDMHYLNYIDSVLLA